MADVFVWSGAGGGNDGSQWEDAYVSLMRDFGAEGGFTPGTDFVYVRSVHDEDIAGGIVLTGSTAEGTGDPVRVLSVVGDTTGTTPGALATGATVRTNGDFDIALVEKLYVYGVSFFSDNNIGLGTNAADHWIVLESCRLELVTASGADTIVIGAASTVGVDIKLLDTDIDFAHADQGFNINQVHLLWDSGTLDLNVANLFEDISGMSSIVTVRNVDLSICAGVLVNSSSTNVSGIVRFERCLLHASATIDETIDVPGHRVETFLCQSGTDADPAYQMRVRTYQGATEVDTARYRTGGATDGLRTNPYSWGMDSSLASNVIELYEPLESMVIDAWSPGDASTAHVYRIYFASGATLQDDEIWFDLVGPNSAATDSLGVRNTTRVAPLGTPANHTTDSASTWTGADVGTLQYMEISYTPDKPGPVTARIYLAKPSERVSVDPVIYIDP